MRVFVVRHACAGRKGAWPGTDEGRPLDATGERQASALADLLEGEDVRRLVSSPTRRCLDTLGPLARRLELTIERTSALEARSGGASLGSLIADERLDRAVLCTHGEVMQPFLEQVWASGVPVLHPATEDELLHKGTGWSLEVEGGRVVSLERCAPIGQVDCGDHHLTGQWRARAEVH